MTQEAEKCVTGRQVLLDAITFAKDAGAYLYGLGKRVYKAIKTALDKDKTEEASKL